MKIRGKAFFYFKQLKTQEEIDILFQADLEEWIQDMKDAGAWEE